MYNETREELIQMLEECQTEHHKRNLEVQTLRTVARAADAYVWGRTDDAKELETLVHALPPQLLEPEAMIQT